MNSVLLGYNDILNNYINTRQAHKTNKTSCPLPFSEGKNVFKILELNLQKYGRSQYDWPTLSFKFIAYKLLPEWRLIEFWRVFRCKKSTLFRARQVTYEMHNNTPLSHPKLATFGFYAKSTEAIFFIHWSNILCSWQFPLFLCLVSFCCKYAHRACSSVLC